MSKNKNNNNPTRELPQQTTHRKATAADLERCQVPDYFSTKKWDPTEVPICIASSVFDGNSLGKWIYDWTLSRFQANTPASEAAAHFWLAFIQLGGRMKRIKNRCNIRILTPSDQTVIDRHTHVGKAIWRNMIGWVQECENFMFKANTDELKENSGFKFVEKMFDDRVGIPRTQGLIEDVGAWLHKYDTTVKEIVKLSRELGLEQEREQDLEQERESEAAANQAESVPPRSNSNPSKSTAPTSAKKKPSQKAAPASDKVRKEKTI